MKNYLVDTNVIIDMIAKREDFYVAANEVFDAAYEGKHNLYVCALSYSNIYYILRRSFGKAETLKVLEQLTQYVTVLPVDADVINKALESNFTDFEDAIQYYSAFNSGIIDGIITRNIKDFKESELEVLHPEAFVS